GCRSHHLLLAFRFQRWLEDGIARTAGGSESVTVRKVCDRRMRQWQWPRRFQRDSISKAVTVSRTTGRSLSLDCVAPERTE
uniref:Uncharacterized protein n=1 Tax=Anopheles albimanus TaxID=7167 RepID=A0A182FBT0_ANOAL